jgi:uncharacterized protein YbjT (DUF2867 family)
MASSVREQKKLFAPIGGARVSVVDVRDIAPAAATALTEPGHKWTAYTITGPPPSPTSDRAKAIGDATGA